MKPTQIRVIDGSCLCPAREARRLQAMLCALLAYYDEWGPIRGVLEFCIPALQEWQYRRAEGLGLSKHWISPDRRDKSSRNFRCGLPGSRPVADEHRTSSSVHECPSQTGEALSIWTAVRRRRVAGREHDYIGIQSE